DYYGPSVPRVLNARFGRRVSLSTVETQIQEIAPGGEGAVDRFGDRKVRGARLGILRCGLRKHAEAVESSTRGDATDPGRRCSSRGDDPCAMRTVISSQRTVIAGFLPWHSAFAAHNAQLWVPERDPGIDNAGLDTLRAGHRVTIPLRHDLHHDLPLSATGGGGPRHLLHLIHLHRGLKEYLRHDEKTRLHRAQLLGLRRRDLH